MTARPDRSEASGYYFTYIDLVPDGDVREQLDAQGGEFADFLNGISEQKSLYRYAPDKWTIRDVVNHISDTERLFVFRALWFAREFESPLPSFDQNIAVSSAKADDRAFRSLVDEFSAIRAGTTAFFRSLPDEAWSRRGIASDNPFTVRALAYMAVGHVTHHTKILQERYLLS
jgi:DinB superfamily